MSDEEATKRQLDEMRPSPEELARFWDEWALKDGNSPGYNNQKAKTYGQQANGFRLRAEAAEVRALRAEAEAAAMRTALENWQAARELSHSDPGWAHVWDRARDSERAALSSSAGVELLSALKRAREALKTVTYGEVPITFPDGWLVLRNAALAELSKYVPEGE